MRTLNSFKSASGLLSASLSVSHFFSETSHCTTFSLTREREQSQTRTQAPFFTNTQKAQTAVKSSETQCQFQEELFHFSNVQICGRADCHDCHFYWQSPAQNTSLEDASFSLRSAPVWAQCLSHVQQQAPACKAKRCECVWFNWQAAGMEHIPQAVCPAHASKHSACFIWQCTVCVCLFILCVWVVRWPYDMS